MIETPNLIADHMARAERSVVIIGLMGAGKSTIGRRLAAALETPFADADAEIEAAAGQSISEIFTVHGEAAFREGERKVILRLLTSGPKVIATGGGAYMDAETRAAAHAHGLVVWLRADLELLVKRTARRDTRPLLRQGDPRAILSQLMAARYPIYAEADVIIDSADGPHEHVVSATLEALAAHVAAEDRR